MPQHVLHHLQLHLGPRASVAALLKLTEHYCVVYQTLASSTVLEATIESTDATH